MTQLPYKSAVKFEFFGIFSQSYTKRFDWFFVKLLFFKIKKVVLKFSNFDQNWTQSPYKSLVKFALFVDFSRSYLSIWLILRETIIFENKKFRSWSFRIWIKIELVAIQKIGNLTFWRFLPKLSIDLTDKNCIKRLTDLKMKMWIWSSTIWSKLDKVIQKVDIFDEFSPELFIRFDTQNLFVKTIIVINNWFALKKWFWSFHIWNKIKLSLHTKAWKS